MPKQRDPRIDAYIAESAEFARPILLHLRRLVHRECPAVVETMKWSFPHFQYDGTILCSMAAFKQHCAFGFWHDEMTRLLEREDAAREGAMGALGRITSLKDLPKDPALRRYLRHAMKLIDAGAPARARAKPRPALPVPRDLAAALKKNRAARTTFENFSPSHRREYIEWIIDAKRDETRRKRLATTLEWLTAGKPRNWKYS